jgi:transcriptional regulator with XRE-family HTH domain
MKLSEYRKSAGLTLGQFAEIVGVSDITIGRYERGERTPKPKIMTQIVRVTDGAVTPNDFLEEAA